MSKLKKLKFSRYGGLNTLKQDHFLPDSDPNKGFHNPPCRYGFFAFVEGYEDNFLLGATDEPGHVSGKSQWLKDDDGNLVEDKREYFQEFDEVTKRLKEGYHFPKELKALLKKRKIKEKQLWTKRIDHTNYLTVMKPPKIFEYYGELWHHLGEYLKPGQIIGECGSWVKSTYEDWLIAFDKNRHDELRYTHGVKFGSNDSKQWDSTIKDRIKRTNPYIQSPFFTTCKDHLEVFIEKLK